MRIFAFILYSLLGFARQYKTGLALSGWDSCYKYSCLFIFQLSQILLHLFSQSICSFFQYELFQFLSYVDCYSSYAWTCPLFIQVIFSFVYLFAYLQDSVKSAKTTTLYLLL
mgnify:CR=1 FL=1